MCKLNNIYCCECGSVCGYTWGEPVGDILCHSCARPIAELMNYYKMPNAPALTYSNTPAEEASRENEHLFHKAFYNFKYFTE